MNTLKYFLLLLTPVLWMACNKKLDLAPENTVVDKDVFKTEAGTEQALAEAYFNLFKASTGGLAYIFGDFTTPSVFHSEFYNVYDNGEAIPADGSVQSTWTGYFKTINIANNVVDRIGKFSAFNQDKQNQFIAEAKFIRAFAYLELLKMFGDGALSGDMEGLGLPLQLTPFEGYNTGEVVPRSTNGQIYDQIVSDLKEIGPFLLDKFNPDLKTRSRATKGAANALLARCYLYMHKYPGAAEAAKLVLDQQPGTYMLTNNLLQLFPPNPDGGAKTLTSEYIFAFPISQMVSSSTSMNNNLANGYYFKRSFWINKSFISEFEPGDLRVSQLIFPGDQIYNIEHFNEFTTFKFNNPNGRDNVPMIRLAEVMLTRAEALARTTSGINDEAVSLLNTVRTRSLPSATPFVASDFPNADALVERILDERKFELAFEGFYRYDLIRTGKPLHTPDLPEAKKVLPIPQIEIDISDRIIKQNPGYLQ